MAIIASKSRKGFRLQEETYNPKRIQKTIPREAWSALGFRADMTLEEAKARAKQINQQRAIETRKIIGASRRIKTKKILNEVYLPKDEVALFEDWLFRQYEDNQERLPVIRKYWNATMEVISDLAIDPKDFSMERAKILNHCKQFKWSHDYIKRIIRLMDQWGIFTARRRNWYYEPIPKLTSHQIEKIADSREDVKGVRTEAAPLNWIDLKNAKDRFESENLLLQWNWMFIATWFGLRQPECDNTKNPKYWRTYTDIQTGIIVLEIYQTKLTGLKKEKRWKQIPVIFDEQKEALKLIQSGNFQRPLNKTLYRLIGHGIQTGSPRKGFTDLLLSRGVSFEDASAALGHASIAITYKVYKDKKRFKLPKSG